MYSYTTDSPPGLEAESVEARRIAQLQPERWEALLARQLLHDVLDDFDGELEAARHGRVFVPHEERLAPVEYIAWAQMRLANVGRMMSVAQNLLVLDFMEALKSPYSSEKPARIRSVVHRIREFYSATVQFELDRHKIEPPEGAERLHQLQADWSDPIRDGVRQLYSVVDQLISVNLKTEERLSLVITIDSPPNVDEYCNEISRLEVSGVFS